MRLSVCSRWLAVAVTKHNLPGARQKQSISDGAGYLLSDACRFKYLVYSRFAYVGKACRRHREIQGD